MIDRKSWATGFSDGLKEALVVIEGGTYRYDEERKRLVDAINNILKNKYWEQKSNG
jgi:hypothetical protein